MLKKLISIASSALPILLLFTIATVITNHAPVLNTRSFIVHSGSMEPAFPAGSIVYSHRQVDYNIGDVITFNLASNQNVTHRIVSKKEGGSKTAYYTKGDANNIADAVPVSSTQILGKVIFFVPIAGKLVNLLKTPIYFYSLVIFPTSVLILMELWSIKKALANKTDSRIMQKIKYQIKIGQNYNIDFK